jgi:hypothetical protein
VKFTDDGVAVRIGFEVTRRLTPTLIVAFPGDEIATLPLQLPSGRFAKFPMKILTPTGDVPFVVDPLMAGTIQPFPQLDVVAETLKFTAVPAALETLIVC